MENVREQEDLTIASSQLGKGAQRLQVESSSFQPGGPIPGAHAGAHGRSPSLKWSKPPAGTREVVIFCEDPDAPSENPFVHWIVTGLPPSVTELPEGLPPSASPLSSGATQGRNDMGRQGYFGPEPPRGHGVHHYHFQVFAVGERLPLHAPVDRDQLYDALRGHILAWGEVVGTFQR